MVKKSDSVTADDLEALTPPKKLKALLKMSLDTAKEVRSMNGTVAQKIGESVENDFLHPKAFGVIKMAAKMTDEKLAEFLPVLAYYIDASGLQERADKIARLPMGDEDDNKPAKPKAAGKGAAGKPKPAPLRAVAGRDVAERAGEAAE